MSDPITWHDFEPRTLQRAKGADRPIVMMLTVPWCHHCRELEHDSFGASNVIRTVNEHFVAVRVDAERRPDVNERFGTGSWPTVAFLTPDGDLIANDNFLSADELHQRLKKVLKLWHEHRTDLQRGLQELWSHKSEGGTPRRGRLNKEMVEDVVDAVYEKFDHRHGGWGEGAKFPHPEAIDFALVQVAKRSSDRMREVVTLTLDKMQESPLHDRIDGGFFRFSKTSDWRSPNFEKLLDTNAKVLRAYIEAYQLFRDESYRETAEGIIRWMLRFLRDPEHGALHGSQDGDAEYYNLDAEGRARHTPPAVDRTVHCHANALAVTGLLKASVVLDKPEYRDAAMRILGFLLEEMYDGREVYHYWDGTYHLAGMLGDQACLIRALIDASQLLGDADLLLPAEAIAEQTIARQKAPDGGFYDILNDPRQSGSMRRRNRSILENAMMAESLVRLSYLSRRPEFYDEAIGTLEAFSNDYKEYGYYVAGFGRAVDLVFYEPLVLTIVGDRDSEQAQALRSAALADYVPSRIVQMLDPAHDPILIGRSGYKVEDAPVVYITVGRTTRQAARSPSELATAIEEIECERRGRAR
jgi:uncharacterized protein YyaL (SSP411 family)